MSRFVARLSLVSLRAYWRPRALRTREGVARSFGAVFRYDAETRPLTANAAQVLIGSVSVAFSLLLIFL
jgi:hypothetical protein